MVSAGASYLLGLRDSRANGAALLTTVASTLCCLIAYSEHNACPWVLAFVVTAGQVTGAAVSRRLKGDIPSVLRLRPAFAIVVILLGLGMIFLKSQVQEVLPIVGIKLQLFGFLIGSIIGLVSGILESGGVLTVPAAHYLLKLPVLSAQGLSILVLLLVSLPAAIAYIGLKAVEGRSASWIPFGAVFGALVGAYYATSRFSPSALIEIEGLIIVMIGLYHLMNNPRSQSIPSKRERE